MKFMGINSESAENDKQDLMKGVLVCLSSHKQMDLELVDPMMIAVFAKRGVADGLYLTGN